MSLLEKAKREMQKKRPSTPLGWCLPPREWKHHSPSLRCRELRCRCSGDRANSLYNRIHVRPRAPKCAKLGAPLRVERACRTGPTAMQTSCWLCFLTNAEYWRTSVASLDSRKGHCRSPSDGGAGADGLMRSICLKEKSYHHTLHSTRQQTKLFQ